MMARLRRATVALLLAGLVAVVIRLRGSGGRHRRTVAGGELSGDELR